MENKIVVGYLEKVKINGKEVIAKIDSGATRSSIDLDLASELKLGPILKKSIIVSSHGRSVRPVIKAKIEIGGKKINAFFNISSRSHLIYKILIGRNILNKGFLIDPSKSVN
ncbi:MAG: RimK/LysX family protein [Nanoarchaeota archaeon]